MVDHPGKPVVLALGAYAPSQWQIQIQKGTHLAAVIISGHHAQTLIDIPPSVPVLNISHDNRSPCGYFYLTGSDKGSVANVDEQLRKIMGRGAERYVLAQDGRLQFVNNRPALELSH